MTYAVRRSPSREPAHRCLLATRRRADVELPREKIKKCKACKLVEYCSRECQVKDWKNGHKKDCKILRQQHQQTKQ